MREVQRAGVRLPDGSHARLSASMGVSLFPDNASLVRKRIFLTTSLLMIASNRVFKSAPETPATQARSEAT